MEEEKWTSLTIPLPPAFPISKLSHTGVSGHLPLSTAHSLCPLSSETMISFLAVHVVRKSDSVVPGPAPWVQKFSKFPRFHFHNWPSLLLHCSVIGYSHLKWPCHFSFCLPLDSFNPPPPSLSRSLFYFYFLDSVSFCSPGWNAVA